MGNDASTTEPLRVDMIKKVSVLIKSVVYSGSDGYNKEIASLMAAQFVRDCDGINTLKDASNGYTGQLDAPKLWAVQSVWGVLRNITCKPDVMKSVIRQEQAIILLDTGLNVVVSMKSVKGREASSVLEDAFITMSNVVSNGYVDKSLLYEKNVIPNCMKAFTTERNELVTNKAINFFNWCHNKDLLEGAPDEVYEVLL